MNTSKTAYLSDAELTNVRGGGVSSHVPNKTGTAQGGSGPAGTQNPTLGGMDAGVSVLKEILGRIVGF